MTNNDILRRLRYILSLSDVTMIKLFELGKLSVDNAMLSQLQIREGMEGYVEMKDKELAAFLNGLIIDKRGKQEGREPIAEDRLTNNLILKKIKIALNLTTDDIVEIFKGIDKQISTSEIGSFLRKPGHNKFRELNGQYLRNLLFGLQTQATNKHKKQ